MCSGDSNRWTLECRKVADRGDGGLSGLVHAQRDRYQTLGVQGDAEITVVIWILIVFSGRCRYGQMGMSRSARGLVNVRDGQLPIGCVLG